MTCYESTGNVHIPSLSVISCVYPLPSFFLFCIFSFSKFQGCGSCGGRWGFNLKVQTDSHVAFLKIMMQVADTGGAKNFG